MEATPMTRDRQDNSGGDRPSDPPAGGGATPDRRTPMAPGDEAPAGTPGTGENVCRMCGGKGTIRGQTCPECQGSGTVIEGIGGA
jgi:hypothetical protein